MSSQESQKQAKQAKQANEWDLARARSAAVDWSKVDWSRLKPSDVSVRMGPMMTEEQFAEYRKTRTVAVLNSNIKPREDK